MSILVSVDPGIYQGWARFVNGVLSSCGTGHPPIDREDMALPTDVVIEKPEYRAHEKKNVRVDDLITLAVRVGRLAQQARRMNVTLPTPTEWKGSVPKRIHQPRILEALTDAERDVVARGATRPRAKDLDSNVVDAVGLGLWKLGRLAR